MEKRRWTDRGFEVEGPLRVVVEEDLALVLVGEHFLDDLLRERFATEVLTDERTEGMSLELGHVRLALERLDGQSAIEPGLGEGGAPAALGAASDSEHEARADATNGEGL